MLIRRRDFVTGAAALAACSQFATAAGAREQDRLPAGFYNFTGSNLRYWEAALAAQLKGTSNAIIGCLGDSTVAGHGAAGSELGSDAKSLSWPTQLANRIPAGSWSSVWGDNNITAAAGELHQFDDRLGPDGWTINYLKESETLCGGFLRGHSAARQSFTPTNQVDTIEAWYVQSPEHGYFTIDVDGGRPLTTIDCEGGNALLQARTICPLGFHTINLQGIKTSSRDIYVVALRAYNSEVKEVSVYNLGACGWGSADFVADAYAWSTLRAIVTISPNLVIFEAGIINDWNGRVPLSTVTSNLKAVINALKSINCDVILMSGVPSKSGDYASYEIQESFVANMKSAAYAFNLPFIDIWELFGRRWKSAAMFDGLHPNEVGCRLIAEYAEMAVLNPSARSLS